MKKLMLFCLIMYTVSCANPEDHATGNPDFSSFNSDEEKVLNSRPGPTDPNGQSDVANPDTSASPSTMQQNANSKTTGTNRAYGNTDSTPKK